MTNAEQYFQAYHSYFWQWEDGSEVIAIPNGSTIAYRALVLDTIQLLSGQGLPPFGSLLLAIMATNPTGPVDINTVYAIINEVAPEQYQHEKAEAIAFLKLLSEVPSAYREGKSRVLLFQTLFAECHNRVSSRKSKRILAAYKSEETLDNAPVDFHPKVFHQDFRTISLLNKRFSDVSSIVDALSSVPIIADEVLPAHSSAGLEGNPDWVEALIENPKTFPVGSLVHRIWSGLRIPMRHALPSEQPMGGVSDLTNKGSFDRLLISEFAYDDLTLLSRLANQEALYLHREVPPSSDHDTRVVLLDISLKNWGTPRTIAFALLLAIARHPKSAAPCQAFAVGSSYEPLPFGSTEEVITSLQQLDGSLHPAAGLAQFFQDHPGTKRREVIVMMSPDTLRLPSMQKMLPTYAPLVHYWLHPDRTGRVTLYHQRGHHRKHIQDFHLPLDKLWQKHPPPVNATATSSTATGLLFPYTSQAKRMLSAPDGTVFCITTDKKVFRFGGTSARYAQKGWELVCEALPFAADSLEVGTSASGNYLLLLFSRQRREIVLLNLKTGRQQTVAFPEWRSSAYPHFFFYQGRFYYLFIGYPSRYWTLEPGDTQMASFENIPKDITDAYKKRLHSIETLTQQMPSSPGVLKNINSVFINQVGNLVFNIHELQILNGRLRLQNGGFVERRHVASVTGKGQFRFSDGSSITLHRSGRLTLVSSDPAIPTLFIPSVVSGTLGVATETVFAGNEYYLPPHWPPDRVIQIFVFYKKYIAPFIQTIEQHGTTH